LPSGVSVRDVRITSHVKLVSRQKKEMLGGIVTVEGKVRVCPKSRTEQLYREYRAEKAASVFTRFIPYYVWANRGPSEMTVWLPLHAAQ
jgi:DUF1680 family protein